MLRQSFDIATMLADIAEHELTHVAMVPTMFSMLLEHPDFAPERLASLRYVVYGGAPVADRPSSDSSRCFPGSSSCSPTA